MRILFLSAFPPNKKTAGQNYTRQLLKDLSKVNQVDLIYWEYPNHEIEVCSSINIIKKCDYPSGFSLNSKLLRYFPLFSKRYSKNIQNLINSISTNYDVVYFDFSQTFVFSYYLEHPRKIGMSHDVILQKYSRRNIFQPFLYWIKMSEKSLLKSFNEVYTFSKKDTEYIQNHYNILSHPVSFYIDPLILRVDFEQIEVKDYLVMYGAWNRKENQESIEWVLNHIHEIPMRIKIIGGGLPDTIRNKVNGFPNMEYIGFVDNPYIEIAQSKGMLAPLFNGAGVKVKTIESLALGTPIIGTDITFEGIDNIVYDDKSVFINISNMSMGNAINQLGNLSPNDKQSIRNIFIDSYTSDKFVDKLK